MIRDSVSKMFRDCLRDNVGDQSSVSASPEDSARDMFGRWSPCLRHGSRVSWDMKHTAAAVCPSLLVILNFINNVPFGLADILIRGKSKRCGPEG